MAWGKSGARLRRHGNLGRLHHPDRSWDVDGRRFRDRIPAALSRKLVLGVIGGLSMVRPTASIAFSAAAGPSLLVQLASRH